MRILVFPPPLQICSDNLISSRCRNFRGCHPCFFGNNDIHRRKYIKILTPPFHQASDDMDFENCSMKHEGGGAIDDDDVDNDVDDDNDDNVDKDYDDDYDADDDNDDDDDVDWCVRASG